MGVHFRPGGGGPLLGLPAHELHGSVVALADVWPAGRAAELRERLLAARDHGTRFRILERTLLSETTDTSLHPAVSHALEKIDAIRSSRCGSSSSRFGLSQRRFIQTFRAQVGLALGNRMTQTTPVSHRPVVHTPTAIIVRQL